MTKCVCKECDWQATNGDVCEPCADEGCGKSNLTPYTQGFRAGQINERERIIKLIWENAEMITNQYFYHNPLIGEPTAFLISIIEGENK